MKSREQVVNDLVQATLSLNNALNLVKVAAITDVTETDTYDVLAMACAGFLGAYAQGVSFAKEDSKSEGA